MIGLILVGDHKGRPHNNMLLKMKYCNAPSPLKCRLINCLQKLLMSMLCRGDPCGRPQESE